jgi:hypothetical protein
MDIPLSTLYEARPGEQPLRCSRSSREKWEQGPLACYRDVVEGASFLFMRLKDSLKLSLEGAFALEQCPAGGWLLKNRAVALPSYWFPVLPKCRRLDSQGHILEERAADLRAIEE